MNGNFAENEFINLKKAKYNSARRRVSENASSGTVRTAGRVASGAGYSSVAAAPAAVRNTRAAANSETVGLSEVGAVAAEYVGEKIIAARRKKARERAASPIIVRKRVKAKAFPVSFVFYAIIMTVTFMFIAFNYSIANELSYDTAALEDEIEYYTKENERLSLELEKKTDLEMIEYEAANRLGMVKSADVYKQYVSLSGSDKVVVSDKASDSAYLGTTLDSLKRSIGKIFE